MSVNARPFASPFLFEEDFKLDICSTVSGFHEPKVAYLPAILNCHLQKTGGSWRGFELKRVRIPDILLHLGASRLVCHILRISWQTLKEWMTRLTTPDTLQHPFTRHMDGAVSSPIYRPLQVFSFQLSRTPSTPCYVTIDVKSEYNGCDIGDDTWRRPCDIF